MLDNLYDSLTQFIDTLMGNEPQPPLQKPQQQDLNKILQNLPSSGHIRFADTLKDAGFTSEVHGLYFEANWSAQLGVDFSGCQFEGVTFSGNIQNALFTGNISHTHFNKVNFSHTLFNAAQIENTAFNEVSFNYSMVNDSSFENVWFMQNTLDYSVLHNNQFNHTMWLGTEQADNQAPRNGFCGNQFEASEAIDSPLPFLQTAGVEHVHLEKPIIGVVSFSDWFVPATEAITQCGGVPEGIIFTDLLSLGEKLDFEVKTGILEYYKEGMFGKKTIPEFLLEQKSEAIVAIKEYAKTVLADKAGLWIPGDGDDIHPEFYHQVKTPSTDTASTYVKEILEFALIDEALKHDKPIMGVCHGSQIVNVFLGGDLMQSLKDYVKKPTIENQQDMIAYFKSVGMAEFVQDQSPEKLQSIFKEVQQQLLELNDPWHLGYQPLDVHKPSGLIGSAVVKGILGNSQHTQAVKVVSDELEVIASYENIIKATQAKDGRPIMLTQFHPEYMATDENIQIIKNFIRSAEKAQGLKAALSLADILQFEDVPVKDTSVRYYNGGFHYDSQTPAELVKNYEPSSYNDNNQCAPQLSEILHTYEDNVTLI